MNFSVSLILLKVTKITPEKLSFVRLSVSLINSFNFISNLFFSSSISDNI